MKLLSHEERLRTLELFGLGKAKFLNNPKTDFQYLKGVHRKDGEVVFFVRSYCYRTRGKCS